ncbi:hypothetical protein [Streptomyces daghestanicus]|uniref:Integral membrane protein n=1 Tax=Streptomyces daghestanicus TaxID=66885 RepID=A0ABQ3Q037_9ACTN|nr:hypothetical protein [Streptomyces daghestanicus]GGU64722.1 hypothetical protein GCM10010259_64070 [Streptomyces daghestanicus]GHI30609.1 hypothetical protein Sdagh_23390 [Streptomyces daghestanicus]
MTRPAPALLPVSAAALSADPRLLEAVREYGRAHGYDYLDDTAVRRGLAEHRAALHRTAHGAPVWAASLVGTAGLAWLLWAALSGPGNIALAVVPPALLLVLAVAAFVRVHRQGRRQLRHPFLEGYRHVLAAALAHGVPVAVVPAWLTGRGGGDIEVAPLPPYTAPAGGPAPARRPQTPVGTAAPLPARTAAVKEYERIAERGGWHDEAGWVLVVAGALGVGYAVTRDTPAAYAAVLLTVLGIWTWLAGHRLGRRRAELAAEARRYVDELARAQAAGTAVPELSPPLRKLFDSRL